MDLKRSFILEAEELLVTINDDILLLEENPNDSELINKIFRAAHTLKGSAAIFGFTGINLLTHSLETVLDLLRDQKIEVESNLTDLLLSSFDEVRSLIERVDDGEADPHGDAQLLDRIGEYKIYVDDQEVAPASLVIKEHHSVFFNKLKLKAISQIVKELIKGKSVIQLVIETNEQMFFFGQDPFLAVKQLGKLADIIDLLIDIKEIPEWQKLDPLQCYSDMQLIISADPLVEMDKLYEIFEFFANDMSKVSISKIEVAHLFFSPEEQSTILSLDEKNKLCLVGEDVIGLQNILTIDHAVREIIQNISENLISILAADNFRNHDRQALYGLLISTEMLDSYIEREIWVSSERSLSIPEWWKEVWESLSNHFSAIVSEEPTETLQDFCLDVWELCRPQQVIVADEFPISNEREEDLSNRSEDITEGKIGETGEEKEAAAEKNEPIQTNSTDEIHDAPELSSKEDSKEPTPIAAAREGRKEDSKSTSTKKESANKLLRIEQSKIDTLMELVGELVIAKNSLPYLIKKLTHEFDVPIAAKELKEQHGLLDRISKELQDVIMDIRMLPLSYAFAKFHRFVRDTAQQLNKKVHLEIIGEETKLDKNIVEALSEPLIHIVRNSIDHGLENIEERIKHNKSPEGKLRIRAWQEGEQAFIEIFDDGQGVNIERVKTKAIEKGLVDLEEIEAMKEEEILQLIFKPGLSTNDEVTSLSGRGVGMDSVLSTLLQLNGKINVASEKDKGTTILLELPLSLTMTQVLQVELNDTLYGIPLDQIKETVRITKDTIQTMQRIKVITIREEIIPVVDLSKYFNIESQKSNFEYMYVVILKNGISLLVDSLHGQQEVVIKPLDHDFSALSYLSGASIMGDGTVLLILNAYAITVL